MQRQRVCAPCLPPFPEIFDDVVALRGGGQLSKFYTSRVMPRVEQNAVLSRSCCRAPAILPRPSSSFHGRKHGIVVYRPPPFESFFGKIVERGCKERSNFFFWDGLGKRMWWLESVETLKKLFHDQVSPFLKSNIFLDLKWTLKKWFQFRQKFRVAKRKREGIVHLPPLLFSFFSKS